MVPDRNACKASNASVPKTNIPTKKTASAAVSNGPFAANKPLPKPAVTSQIKPVTSSDSSIVSRVMAVISEEAGIDPSDLSPSAEFGDYGIDSLLSLTICGRLQEELGLSVPSSLFADYPTVNDLSNFFQRSERPLSLSESSVDDQGIQTPEQDTDLEVTSECETRATSVEGPNDETESVKTLSNGPDAPSPSTSILLQGNPKSATKILFLFPDGAGSATSYASLAKISSDVVVYGLNCPWMKTPQDMTRSLEHLTAKYLIEIRRRQPRGPYYFGGWSAGGICAYEAAQQLVCQGEKVARLILLDSPNPIGLENPPDRMYDFFESLDIFGVNGKAPPSWLRPHFSAFLSLLDEYSIQPFMGPPLNTHITYARDGICKHPSDPRPEIRPDDPREMLWLLNNRTDFSGSGWAELVGAQNLTITVLDDVNHFSLVARGPKMQELSAFISRAME
jgi:naphtho-gamma-pyrone polyketide synthase